MRHECAHQACHCEVPNADDFCSPHCRQSATQTMGVAEAMGMNTCSCGHGACVQRDEGARVDPNG